MITRPINLTDDEILRILNGKKKTISRILKPCDQPPPWAKDLICYKPFKLFYFKGTKNRSTSAHENLNFPSNDFLKCPFGKIGDVLYGREKFNWEIMEYQKTQYKLDKTDEEWSEVYSENYGDDHKIKWISANFMPIERARIFLKIKDLNIKKRKVEIGFNMPMQDKYFWYIDFDRIDVDEVKREN